MRILVIYAHPNPGSFNHAVLEAFTNGLGDAGHTVEILDLYDLRFEPRLRTADFAQFTGGEMPGDVRKQQEKVAKADALVFIHPVWHWRAPAILEGWLQRVFSHGFAFRLGPQGVEGILKHEKVLIISTTNGREELYKASGIEAAMRTLDSAMFIHVCGIQHVEHVFLYEVGRDAELRKSYLERAYRLGKTF